MTAEALLREAGPKPFTMGRELRACARLAAPLVAAQVAMVGMGLTDTLMMGSLGPGALAGGALGTSYFSTLLVVSGGVVAPVGPFVAEARAQGDAARATDAVRAGCLVATAIGLVGTLLLLAAEPTLLLLGQEPSAVRSAGAYLRCVAPGFLPALLLAVLRHALAAHDRSRLLLAVTATGALLNALADYLLIHGGLGLPALGLAGVGAASAVVNWIMLGVAVGCAHRDGMLTEPGARLRPSDTRLVGSLLRQGAPVAVMFGLEVGLFAVTTVNVGRHGSIWLAAHQIALQTTSVTYMIPQALSQASALRVAHWRGHEQPRTARLVGLLMMIAGSAFMLAMGAVLWTSPQIVVGLYMRVNDAPDTTLVDAAAQLLAVAGVFQVFDGIQVTASGALRGFGDSRAPMLIAVASYGLIGAPLSFVVGRRAGAPACWIALSAGLAAAAIGLSWRFARVGLSASARPSLRAFAAPAYEEKHPGEHRHRLRPP